MILVNYDKILKFQFNGKHYEGYEGDTLASALLRKNVKIPKTQRIIVSLYFFHECAIL